MTKIIKFLLSSLFILFLFVGVGCQNNQESQEEKMEENRAVEKAYKIYNEKVGEGVDVRSGPCISEKIELDPPLSEWWVVDIAHKPRTSEDNDLNNQCESYRRGDAKHFVELDINGNLIKAR